MLKACVYSIDQGIQVLYTLSLLSLLELASHTDKLILYPHNDFTHTQVTVFNSRFLSLQSRSSLLVAFNSHTDSMDETHIIY